MTLKRRHHQIIRLGALAVLGTSLSYMATQGHLRADVTQEQLSQLTPGTEAILAGITVERPVMVHAFISEDVPEEYQAARTQLLNVLHEMEARGGEGLQVRIVAPEPYSPEAEEALEKFGIMPEPVVDRVRGRMKPAKIFMGLAFVSGPREQVVPFLDLGLSPEYEIARALEVVTQDKKKVVGVLRTDAPLMGNFDLQTRSQQPAWQIVEELRKQYEVRSLNPKTAIPDDVDVLFVPQLSSLTQAELDAVKTYIDAGRAALLTVDPLPLFDLRLAPQEPKLPPPGQGGMFGAPPAGEPKGDYAGLLAHVGVQWPDTNIVFDEHNPNPMFENAPRQIVFVSERPDGTNPFADADPVVDGLNQVVTLFGGELLPAQGSESAFQPLLVTGKSAGVNVFDEFVQRHPLFGMQGPLQPRTKAITHKNHVLAARVRAEAAPGDDGHKGRNVVVIADLDLFADDFFAMHKKGGDFDRDGTDELRLDNVPFLLNVVDSLAGDDRFIELRKRRARYRRLEEVDKLTLEDREERQSEKKKAIERSEAELQEAQKALDTAVEAIRARTDLDETTKAIMLRSAEDVENRRLEAKTEKIKLETDKALEMVTNVFERKVDEIQDRIRVAAILLPPVPALLLGLYIFARKRRRERDNIPVSRRRNPPGKNSQQNRQGEVT